MTQATLNGYAIVPPVSPWDRKHADAIRLDNAIGTFGRTESEAWSRMVRAGIDRIDMGERARRIQHWHDRGYRVVPATLTIPAYEEAKEARE